MVKEKVKAEIIVPINDFSSMVEDITISNGSLKHRGYCVDTLVEILFSNLQQDIFYQLPDQTFLEATINTLIEYYNMDDYKAANEAYKLNEYMLNLLNSIRVRDDRLFLDHITVDYIDRQKILVRYEL